jgi:MFS family permease
MAMVALFAVDHLHLSPAVFGLAIGLGGAGFPLGSVLARRLARRYGLGPALGIVSLPIIVGLVVTVSASGDHAAVMMAAGTFLYGAGSGAFKTNALTIRHLVTPEALATRATAVHRFVTWGVMPIGSVAAGLIATTGGLRAAMVSAVAVAGLCAVPVLSGPMRRARNITRAVTEN